MIRLLANTNNIFNMTQKTLLTPLQLRPTTLPQSSHATGSLFSSRRDALKFAGASFAAAALGGCASVEPNSLEMPAFRGSRLLSPLPFARPNMTMENIIDIKVGLRPFRVGGFVVRGDRKSVV